MKALRTITIVTAVVMSIPIIVASTTTVEPGRILERAVAHADDDDDEESSGLKVFVNLYHNARGSAELCVYYLFQDLGCKAINLSDYSSPVKWGPWTFSPGIVKVGKTFTVCVTNMNTEIERCKAGINGPAKEPEYIYLTMPGHSSSNAGLPRQQQERGINWGQLCRNPIVDLLITEPCYILTTPDGYALTSEGEHVIRCLAAGSLLLLYDPSANTLAAARALGPAVGCGHGG